MSSAASLNLWGASLTLVGHPFSGSDKIKIPYGVDVLYIDQPCTPSFPIRLGKSESELLDQ